MPSASSAPTLPFLERLLDGEKVEWKKLGEVCGILRGKRLTKKELSEGGKYAVFHGGLVPIGFYSESNRKGDTTMVINVGASAGTIGYSRDDFWSSDGCFCISPSPFLLSRFIFYVLQSKDFQIKGKVRIAGIPTLDSNVLEQFPIPIPPLRVQARIVDILDKFTELEAELEARNKQYDFYRNRLLSGPLPHSPNIPHQWEQVPLGSIGEVRMCKRILKQDTTETGEIPFYKIGTFGKSADAFISRTLFEEYKQKYAYPRIGDILISASGTIGRAIEFDGEDAYFQDSNIVWLEHDSSKVINRFLYYCYQIADWKVAKGGTIARLYNDNLKKTLIPLPPLSEQRRIVDILDRFDTLTNSISEGLPREIALRRKQYEYYRDALLRFPPPAPTA